MSENKDFDQAIRETLNSSLDKIDSNVQKKLVDIRKHALLTTDASHKPYGDVIVLTEHSMWKNKKIVGIGAALAASVMLMIISPSVFHATQSVDFSSDIAIYSEVDPDWVTDMDIAYALGDVDGDE